MSELLGLYIDHQMTSSFEVAQRSANVKQLATELAKSGVLLLTTCVRVEIYGAEPALRSIDKTIFFGSSCERIMGAAAISRRLAEIASGAHSQILGESYIGDQLAKAIEFVNPNLPIFQIARLAIDVGRAARERQQFIASFNYDQIVQDIIADRFPRGEQPDRLYIIGSGMLGQGLIKNGLGERFRSTVIVTRNPKLVRKRLRRSTGIEATILRPAEIGYPREPRSIVVVATADVDHKYEASLQNALLRLEPRTIVDLSSIPVLSDPAVRKLNYVNMYSKEFLNFIDQNNKKLSPKIPFVCSDIEEKLRIARASALAT